MIFIFFLFIAQIAFFTFLFSTCKINPRPTCFLQNKQSNYFTHTLYYTLFTQECQGLLATRNFFCNKTTTTPILFLHTVYYSKYYTKSQGLFFTVQPYLRFRNSQTTFVYAAMTYPTNCHAGHRVSLRTLKLSVSDYTNRCYEAKRNDTV